MLARYSSSFTLDGESCLFYKKSFFWQNIMMADDINKIFAQEELLKDLMTSLKPFAIKLTRNQDDALDLIQQTFEKAIMKKDQFKGGSVKAWMSTMMKNSFIDKTRKKTEDLPGDDLQEVVVEGNQISSIEESEAVFKLEKCIKKLSDAEQDIIYLRMSDLSVNEITEYVNKSRVNVSQISARAKIKLNDCMRLAA